MNKTTGIPKGWALTLLALALSGSCFSQTPIFHFPLPLDSTKKQGLSEDSALRIRNLNPYFTLHVDSTLNYDLEINKDERNYFWYIRNSPVGLKINKDNGLLTFKADKSYFLSGKLKYDYNYKVDVGVQNLNNPKEHIDTSFTIVFFTTEIVPSRLKPTVSNVLFLDEGDTISFKVQCETGSFPIESINFYSSIPIKPISGVSKCDDDFTWSPPFDFVRDGDSGKQKLLTLSFVGTNKFYTKDTATIKIFVKDALNYPIALEDYRKVEKGFRTYILQLKYAFVQLDKAIKHNKKSRTTFDLTSASSALGGTVFSSEGTTSAQRTGTILPSVGVALVPVKEAVAPTKTTEQNQASLVRSSIKRLEYTLRDNTLMGEKDMDVVKKMTNLKNELKQTQTQLIDVPIDDNTNMTEEQLNDYFNNPKVNKKYRLKNGG
ncbi:MAG: hypothetical protein P4L51_21080 [Puia sp.]|nr:hypothetical protein [Puia sp.]